MDEAAARTMLRSLFDAAVAAADPAAIVPRHLPAPPRGAHDRGRRRQGVGGDGAAPSKIAWPGPLQGLVVTRYGHGAPCKRIEIVEAAHPVPDARGVAAARRILKLVTGLTADDLVVALISGGGSALLSLPAGGLTLADKQAINRALLASGASIDEMNCVRKHLSAIKGGRLAAAAFPARVVTLVISDVPGDDPAMIASGPTVADPTTFADARGDPRKILHHAARRRRGASCRAARDETPKPGDPRLARAETHIIARRRLRCSPRPRSREQPASTPLILGDAIEGESREVARVMAGIARQAAATAQPVAPPCVLLSGGETTRNGARQGARRPQCRVPARAGAWPCAPSREPTRSPATPTGSTARRRSPARL